MKTTFDAVNVIWSILNPAMVGQISGGVYKYQRPFNSYQEDIVINSLPMVSESISECFVNVNCYVPDIQAYVGDTTTNNVPDTKRLLELALFVGNQLTPETNTETHFYIDSQAMVSSENGKEHYINFKIKFIFV